MAWRIKEASKVQLSFFGVCLRSCIKEQDDFAL